MRLDTLSSLVLFFFFFRIRISMELLTPSEKHHVLREFKQESNTSLPTISQKLWYKIGFMPSRLDDLSLCMDQRVSFASSAKKSLTRENWSRLGNLGEIQLRIIRASLPWTRKCHENSFEGDSLAHSTKKIHYKKKAK